MTITRLLDALAFAALKHRGQRRKDAEASPYIGHPIAVAGALARDGGVTDPDLLVAAILHDTVEDTATTLEEIEGRFGRAVATLVQEVTDDRGLAQADRKCRQVVRAPHLSSGARQLKVADKLANIRDVAFNPPAHWSPARRLEYLDWAEAVVAGCRGSNPGLESAFDAMISEARAVITGEAA
jgi:guanosine-3',5'-bis(diphosphate) 3'-pyrophosphohydrolase